LPDPLIRPFAALRPADGRAGEIAARPYDVLSFEEARASASGRPWSFLHVSRAEIDLPPGTDPHAPEVYRQAARAMRGMVEAGVLIRDPHPRYYVYRMSAGSHVQTGIAAAGSIRAYEENRICRHEFTRPEKERDRTMQIEAVGAHTGPVLCAHQPNPELAAVLDAATAAAPTLEAVTDDQVRHQVWPIVDAAATAEINDAALAMDAIYIADGHHRSAAALRVAEARRAIKSGGGGDEPYEFFLVVSFAADQLRILDYNRVVRDLNGRSPREFLAEIGQRFHITAESAPVRPNQRATFGMFVDGSWYRLVPVKPPEDHGSAVERLDVSLLMREILEPALAIGDPRTDPRIDFVGGGRGLGELERKVTSGAWAVAFSLFPTSLADVMAVADAGQVMPPKSTWFEPKLADGLLSLPLDNGVARTQ
jgi:uncharacterized protein (DUF1015 family)